jgi:hypothetical protein
MTTSLPHAHHEIAPGAPPTLAELVAKARHARQPKTAQLEPHREELLRLRRDGDSVEVLATALRGLGVEISAEALRLWLNRQLPRRKARRSKTARVLSIHEPAAMPPPVEGGPIAAHVAKAMLDEAKVAVANSGTASATEPIPAIAADGTAAVSRTPVAAAAPTRSYVPWRNNFEPLIIGGPRRNPRIARDDL